MTKKKSRKSSRRPRGGASGTAGSGRLPTRIAGVDQIVGGGLPRTGITAVVGGPGTGKTLFGLETLARGAAEGEAGVLVGFEETAERLRANAAAFEWSDALDSDHVRLLDADLADTVVSDARFDIQGLLAMLGAEARRIGACRVVLDGLDVLIGLYHDQGDARREMMRLRKWLADSGLSVVVTAKGDPEGPGPFTELLQYLADCVIVLEQRLVGEAAVRELQVRKYRGCAHSSNRYPFAFGSRGIRVASRVTSLIDHVVSEERVSSGVADLDAMVGGGYHQGSSILITGAPGTAKTTLAGAFAEAACRRRERMLYVSFDEAAEQIVRNLGSVGIRLGPHVRSGMLRIASIRTRSSGPHAHLGNIAELLDDHGAKHLVVDPVSAFAHFDANAAEDAAVQMVDIAKSRGITMVSTSLLGSGSGLDLEQSPVGLSTVADTWLHLSYLDQGGERNRALSIVKSRGTQHSNQVRELVLDDRGVRLADVYTAGGEVLMGTLRWEKEEERRREEAREQRAIEQSIQTTELAAAEIDARVRKLELDRSVTQAELDRLHAERGLAADARETQRAGTRHHREKAEPGAHASGRNKARRRRKDG